MTLKFGTDGVRGVANTELAPDLVLALGRAAARVLAGAGTGPDRPVFLVGRDTRVSGPMLQAALAAGLAGEGVDVHDLGVLPTPGVAALAEARGVAAAVISASHNAYPDNGIKFFAAGGRKLGPATEEALERELAALLSAGAGGAGGGLGPRPAGAGVGRLVGDIDGLAWYRRRLVASLEGRRLDGLRVAVDCANGSASVTASAVLTEAGAEVVAVLAAEPDGLNINDGCGSTDPSRLQQEVVARRADAGLAFDGDADRVIAVDAAGGLVDGDQTLALCALDLRRRGRLAGDTVVVTVMTNLGFRLAMQDHGIKVHETQVGDRHVLEALDAGGWSLGGEQSGHVIFRELATTGDGVLTGLQLLDLVVRAGRPLAELAAEAMVRLPQVLRNVRVADRAGLAAADHVWRAVADEERALGPAGRVLLRASGTEPLVRIMVEAPSRAEADAVAERLAGAVTRSLG